MTVHEYILSHWKDTIRTPGKDDTLSYIKLPNPFTTPTANDYFKNFFYWDTYFTNIGLLIDGLDGQAENNLNIMAFFVDKLGYIPNGDHQIYCSQPPFFTRGVYELYKYRKDKDIIKKYIDFIDQELIFWENDRKISGLGLSQYGSHRPTSKLLAEYEGYTKRLGELTQSEKAIDKFTMAKNFLAIGESGWDFNVRFTTEENRFASLEFAMIDLNCILYDAESKTSAMYGEIGESEKAKEYSVKAENRKNSINKYMQDKSTGIYSDYNYKRNNFSRILTVASLYPYAFNISKDKETCKKIFERLDMEHGLSTAEYRGETTYFQWDYPHIWPSNVYVGYLALKNTGNNKEANLLKHQYLSTVDKVFDKTGKLWEKYNAITGSVSTTIEYETPPMMGWTAAIYEFLYNEKDL